MSHLWARKATYSPASSYQAGFSAQMSDMVVEYRGNPFDDWQLGCTAFMGDNGLATMSRGGLMLGVVENFQRQNAHEPVYGEDGQFSGMKTQSSTPIVLVSVRAMYPGVGQPLSQPPLQGKTILRRTGTPQWKGGPYELVALQTLNDVELKLMRKDGSERTILYFDKHGYRYQDSRLESLDFGDEVTAFMWAVIGIEECLDMGKPKLHWLRSMDFWREWFCWFPVQSVMES
jgi:hypothetical protein